MGVKGRKGIKPDMRPVRGAWLEKLAVIYRWGDGLEVAG
jgi:hypothetical protein